MKVLLFPGERVMDFEHLADCELDGLLGRIPEDSGTTQQKSEQYSTMKMQDFPLHKRINGSCAALLLSNPAALADENDTVAKLYKQGNFAKALEQADAYLALKPKDAQMRFQKGLILTEQNKTRRRHRYIFFTRRRIPGSAGTIQQSRGALCQPGPI